MIFGIFIASTAILILGKNCGRKPCIRKKLSKKSFKQAYKIAGLQQL
jgi:hypothetical protein